MAKRKAARAATKRPAGRSSKPAARKAAKKAKKTAKKAAPSRRATKKKAAKPAVKPAARKAARKTVARKAARPTARPIRRAAKSPTVSKKTAPPPKKTAAKQAFAKQVAAAPRKAPALNRQRRILDDDIVRASPPSSLDMNRTASAARSGRRELLDKFEEHTETSPALTGGDVDADWESAYSVGDEAPGGDNPTPDQDIVDDIGRAVGIEYQDNEELKGADKVEKRDRNRWELDPASSDDWDERD